MNTIGSLFSLPRKFFEDAYLDTGAATPATVTEPETDTLEALPEEVAQFTRLATHASHISFRACRHAESRKIIAQRRCLAGKKTMGSHQLYQTLSAKPAQVASKNQEVVPTGAPLQRVGKYNTSRNSRRPLVKTSIAQLAFSALKA